jgi:hypothetical protein
LAVRLLAFEGLLRLWWPHEVVAIMFASLGGGVFVEVKLMRPLPFSVLT